MKREKLEKKLKDLAFELNIDYYGLDLSRYTDFMLKWEIKKLEKIIKARDSGKLYININDHQSTDWAVGCIGTLKQWRNKAILWADSDENDGVVKILENYEVKNEELIDFINEFWEIEIVKFDKNTNYDIEEFTYLGL